MNNINIQQIREYIQNPSHIDVQFYADYSLHINKSIDDETTISGKLETEFFSNDKTDMEVLSQEIYDACRNDLARS
jgi:UDP-N-acetylglucosamine pyrophosphorylase